MASHSKTDIFNFALGHIGHTETVASTEENSKARKVCSRFYDLALERTLEDFPWDFSIRSVALAEISGFDFPGWKYAYRYPSDCLNARQITDEDGRRIVWWEYTPGQNFIRWQPPVVPFKVVSDEDGRVILTDKEDAYLVYTARVDNPALWDNQFVEALSRLLAYYIAVPLSVDASRAQNNFQSYRIALSEAMRVHLNQGHPQERPESPSIRAMY